MDSQKKESLVFYRKYRPQKVVELDSESVRKELEKILSGKRVPHALLFAGPRGTGKTSSARIVAKAINCKERKGFEPCNACSACESITLGSNVDVMEIDGASNRGIDEIRDLREKIKLAPASLPNKVYIIDEVHMLTTEAFNALLKTLEEPPVHAYFILCTTEAGKIPETILSRCTRINFRRASKEEVLRSIRRVIDGEKIEIEKEAMELVASESDGSFRDGAKMLEQLSLSNKKITSQDVLEVLGVSRVGSISDFLEKIFAKDAKASISFVNEAFVKGVDLKILTVKILDFLRAILLRRQGIEESSLTRDFPNEQTGDLLNLVDLFCKAAVDYKTALIPQLPLEIAIISWCSLGKEGEEKEKKETILVAEREEIEKVLEENSAKEEVKTTKGSSKIKLDDIKVKWLEILKSVKPHNHSVEAFLKASSPKDWDGKYLTLEVFYKFHKERLESEKCRSLVEEVISSMFLCDVKLKFVLGEGKRAQTPKTIENISGAPVPSDVVKAAEEIFKGAVIE